MKTLLQKTETLAEKFTDENIQSRNEQGLNYTDFYKYNNLVKSSKGGKEVYILEHRLYSYIREKVNYFERTFFPSWVQVIKDYSLSPIDRKIELKNKKLSFLTNEVQPIVRTYVDRIMQQLFRTNFTIKTYPLTPDGDKKAKAVQSYIERCFSSSKAKKSLYDQGKEAVSFGPGYVRTGFRTPNEKAIDIKKSITGDNKGRNFKFGKSFAIFEWVSIFSIFGEPFVNFYEQRDIIYRKILPVKTVLDKLASVNYRLTEEHLKFIIDNPKPISQKNYDKIRLIKYYEDRMLNEDNFNIENLYSLTLDNNHVEYIEFWTEDNLVLLMNGYIIYDGPNPLVGRTHPFKVINYTREPGVWISDGVGTLLKGPQKLYNALYNISFDLLKFKAGPVFLKNPGQYIEGNEHILNYEPFTFKQKVGPGKIEVLELPAPDPAVSKAMSDILEMVNLVIAPSMYNQLQGISRSATDSQFRFEGLKDSVISLVQSMNEMLTIVAEEWLEEAKRKMPEKFTIPVFNSKGEIKARQEIKLDDLKGQFIFERDSESIRDINKFVERTQLREITNFLKTFGQDPTTGKRLLDSAKILEEGLMLYNRPQDVILSDDEYLKRLEKRQEKTIEVKKKLEEFQSQLNKPEGGGMPQGGGENNPNYSNYNASGQSKGPIDNMVPEEKPALDIAAIAKAAQES